MRRVLIVARHELLVTLRRPSFRIMTALFPLLGLLALTGVLIYQAVTTEREPAKSIVGYVDDTGLFAGFREQGPVIFLPFPDQAQSTEAFLADEIDALYLIPADYIQTGRVVQVKERRRGIHLDEEGTGPLVGFLLDNLLTDQLPPEHLARVRDLVHLATLEIDETGEPVPDTFEGGRFAFFLILGILIIMSVLFTSGFLLQGLSEEKENRIMEILLSSVTSDQLMLGKLFGLGAAGLVQVLIWVASGVGIFLVLQNSNLDLPSVELPSPVLILAGLLYFLLGYALVGALLAALGAVTTSQREAQQVTFIFILPSIVPLWLLTPLLQNPDGIMALILTLIPFTAPTTVLIRLALDAISPLEILWSLGLLTAWTALAVFLTLRLFRAYLLMYGRRPGLREITRTLAQS